MTPNYMCISLPILYFLSTCSSLCSSASGSKQNTGSDVSSVSPSSSASNQIPNDKTTSGAVLILTINYYTCTLASAKILFHFTKKKCYNKFCFGYSAKKLQEVQASKEKVSLLDKKMNAMDHVPSSSKTNKKVPAS